MTVRGIPLGPVRQYQRVPSPVDAGHLIVGQVPEEVDRVAHSELVGQPHQLLAQRALTTQEQLGSGTRFAQSRDRSHSVARPLSLDEPADEQHGRPRRSHPVASGTLGAEPRSVDPVGDNLDPRVDAKVSDALAVLWGVTEDDVGLLERPPTQRPEVGVEHPLGRVLAVQPVVRDRQRRVPEPPERREVRGEIQVRVGMNDIEIKIRREILRHAETHVVAQRGDGRVEPHDGVPVA